MYVERPFSPLRAPLLAGLWYLTIHQFVNARGNQRWNCFKSDKVAEISYASKSSGHQEWERMLTRLSHPRQGLSRPEVPQQLSHAGGASLPTQGELPVFKP
jgi:hypothetical protein